MEIQRDLEGIVAHVDPARERLNRAPGQHGEVEDQRRLLNRELEAGVSRLHLDYRPFLDEPDEDAMDDLLGLWARNYREVVQADANLVVIPLRSGISYLFDDQSGQRAKIVSESRVVAAWGRSDPANAPNDASRRRGFPRPARASDDRGHLFARASGGGADINLIPMDGKLNRGWTPEGERFREMERYCAARPGTLYFIRPLYSDASGRPFGFDVGAWLPDGLWWDTFSN